MRSFFVLCFLFLFSLTSVAESTIPKKSDWLLLGVEVGLLNKGSVTAPEVENSGTEFGFKGAWSHYFSSWVTDVGLGWRSDEMENNGVIVSTKAFFADLTARYRVTDQLSIGPSLNFLFGQDVSFSDVGTNSDEKSLSIFVGGRLMYDFFLRNQKNVFRLGLQANTDMNIEERQITAVQLIAEFGWPFGRQEEVKAPPKKEKPVVVRKRRRAKPLKLNLMSAGVRFASGSSELIGRSNSIISKLAIVLAKYKGQWSNIVVEGHTDHFGDYRNNVQLSRARADVVKETMVEYGVSEMLVTTTGYGPDKPLDTRKTKEAYARNRRVELKITGANASKKFVRALERVIRGR